MEKRSDEQSLQRVGEYVAAVCTEGGLMVITNVPKLKGPWLAENHSNMSQIAGAALMNGQKDLPVCDISLGSIRTVKYVGTIAYHSKRKTSISNIIISNQIIGKPERFQPFAIRTGLPGTKGFISLTKMNHSGMNILTGNAYPYQEWRCAALGMHMLTGNGMCLTGNAHPHPEWGCPSLGMHILTGNGDMPHAGCISPSGMHILTENT